MSAHETFEIPVAEGRVRVSVVKPEVVLPPVVLVIGDPPTVALPPLPFLDGLVGTFAAQRTAAATFEYRIGDAATNEQADTAVDDASAVFRALLLRDDLDTDRVGVIGVRLGAIIAAVLASRTDQVNRLALLSPATPAELGDGGRLFEFNELSSAYKTSLAALTPLSDIIRHERPTLVLHGAADRVLPPASAFAYVDALELADRDVDHQIMARGDHTLSDPAVRAVAFERLNRFFGAMVAPVTT